MPVYDAYADSKKKMVMEDTWGHLSPQPGRKYSGRILFTHGAYGDIVPIACDFSDLPDSPWFYEDMMQFIRDHIKKDGYEFGSIYRFVGTYVKFKNDNCRFSGETMRIL